MTRKLIVLCVSMALALSPSTVAPQDTDLELAEGVRLTQDESYVSAVITLDKVVRRLAAKGDRPGELARARLYLAAAYLGLGENQRAKASFLEALNADPEVELGRAELPAETLAFFERTRQEALEAAATPREPESEKTGGRSKMLLALLGLGAGAGAVVALTGGELPPGVFESQDTPMWLGDFGLVSSRIMVHDMGGTISSVTVDIEVTHTYLDNLVVTLRHPDATQAGLHDRTGGSSDDRDATFRPTEFDGKTPNGVWTLYVEGDGRLKSWRLTLTVAE
jgi:hypothetical protein